MPDQSIKVEVTGFKESAARLRFASASMQDRIMRGAMRGLVAKLQKGARRRVPVATGALRRSIAISTRVFPSTGTVVGKVFTGAAINAGKLKGGDAWYGHIVERGAKPHLIRPKNGKALFFAGRFTKSVRHPGIKGRYFMRDTEQQDYAEASLLFADYVETKAKTAIEKGN